MHNDVLIREVNNSVSEDSIRKLVVISVDRRSLKTSSLGVGVTSAHPSRTQENAQVLRG